MKKDYTHITFILDRSGSMYDVWSDVEGGYAEFVKQNKEAPGECTFTLVAFDDQIETPVDFQKIADVQGETGVIPRSMTALLDAMGQAITGTGEKLKALKEEDRPDKVLVVIQTDGLENASKEYDNEKISKLIKTQKEKYNWDFMFIGAGEEFLSVARDVGIPAANTMSYNSVTTCDTFSTLGAKSAYYRGLTGEEASMSLSFTEEEREAAKKV